MSGKNTVYNIPNLLCMFRIAIIPVMIWLFYVDSAVAAWVNVALFVIAGITDFLDGYLARMWNQTTILGKFLDSSTDKMLVGVALFLLVAFGRLDGIWIIPAALIYLREILVAGVREFMGLYNIVVHISKMGKWKLTVQMVSIGFLIAGPYGNMLIPYCFEIGKGLFLLATVLTVVSGWSYVREAWRNIARLDRESGL